MDIIKKNLISIIFGVVAVAAVIAAFIPLGSMEQAVQTELEKRAHTHQSMVSVSGKDRQMPVVSPDSTAQEKLPQFPSDKVIEDGEKVISKVKTESEAMRAAAAELNKHTILEPGSLPSPVVQGPLYTFRDKYRALFTAQAPGQLPPIYQSMKAGAPPSPDEIKKKQDDMAAQISKEKLYGAPGQAPANQAQVTAEIQERGNKLPDELRTQVAQNSMVYVNPDAFTMNQRFQQLQGAPDPADVYLAQVQLWVQQDVMSAISEANKGSKNVTEAPVKRLVKLVAPSASSAVAGGGGGGQFFVTSTTVSLTGEPDAAITKDPLVSTTGRASNPMYDVIHLSMEIDVEAEKLGSFLRELTRNRLITPLHMNVKAVDTAGMLGQGYLYGDKQVVNVQMDCEDLFLRQWTVPLMPPNIKKALQIPETAPAAAGEQPPAQPAQPTQ